MTLQAQLMRDEGLRLYPYADTAGKLTIGVGRNLTDVGISRVEAMALLSNDIEATTQTLETAFPWTLGMDEVRMGVLINMAFNMGVVGLAQFKKFLAAVQQGDWQQARAEMLDSAWAEQVGSRAQRLAIQIESGEWQ